MRKALSELHKALRDHQGAVDAYFKAHDALHGTLERCTKSIGQLAGGSPAITGHLGSVAKAVAAHKSVNEVMKAAHGLLHKSVSNAITAIADRSGVTVGGENANAALANGGRSIGRDISGAGDIEHGILPDQAVHGTQKGYTAHDLDKMLTAVGAVIPSNQGLRLFKNATNPHWRCRKDYPVPDLSVSLSNKY